MGVKGSASTAFLIALAFICNAQGQSTAGDTQKTIDGLRQITQQLNGSVKEFYSQLDKVLDRQDRGYRGTDGRIVPSADADLNHGQAEIMWTAARKFATFRMMASRSEGYNPPAIAELDRLQFLIAETRKRVDLCTALMRGKLVVSSAELDLSKTGLGIARREYDQLWKARATAEEAAMKALLALPIDQSERSSSERRAQAVWDSLGRGTASKPQAQQAAIKHVEPGVHVEPAIEVPLLLERRKRVTLLADPSYRMAITDSGVDDSGRHIFYQEEWAQRGISVVRFRWRVAVETSTGQHVLVKRYTPLEVQGSIDELYNHRDRDYLWYLEPPPDSKEPTRDEVGAALDQVTRSREAIGNATQDFRNEVSGAMASQPDVDGGLPDELRRRMFAIRAHIAGVDAILQAEKKVRNAIDDAEAAIQTLEPLAAWSNRETYEASAGSSAWALLLARSDHEIDSVRSAEVLARSGLPPDTILAQENFPALQKNLIVRMRTASGKKQGTAIIKCLQEVWSIQSIMSGNREVRRIVTLFVIDPKTGIQTPVSSGTGFYKIAPDTLLEEVYNEYAADDVSMSSEVS
jgi:hypothetical protein